MILKTVLQKVQFQSHIYYAGTIICFVTCTWVDFDVEFLKGCNVRDLKKINCFIVSC